MNINNLLLPFNVYSSSLSIHGKYVPKPPEGTETSASAKSYMYYILFLYIDSYDKV
jgi:hypothetical protein